VTIKPKAEWSSADHAYAALRAAIDDPSARQAADQNDQLGDVVRKLSNEDLHVIRKIINEQSLSGHGPPFAISE